MTQLWQRSIIIQNSSANFYQQIQLFAQILPSNITIGVEKMDVPGMFQVCEKMVLLLFVYFL